MHSTLNRPNIVFIVADDLGYADLGCYGGRDAPHLPQGKVSPRIDTLAANGLLFTQGYANSPVCSPTRFALMTARYQYRLRGAAEEPINSKARGNDSLGLPPTHPTLPSLLQASGYHTALVGKWHLGYAPHFGPLKSGYDEFFGPMSGGVDYFTHCDSKGVHDLFEGYEETHAHGYLTDLFSQRSVGYVNRMAKQKDGQTKPFFLSLHYTAPHWPWETRDDTNKAVEISKNLFHLDGGNVATYQRMIHHMDEGIGQLVDALTANGQLNNTLIVFTSDNGGERFSDSWPLVGGKMDLTEGGIRVPYVVHWPAAIAQGGTAGTTSEQHCLTMDWSATMLAAAGVGAAADYPLDGASLLPVLGASTTFERPLFWRMNHRGQRAHRLGDWKYLMVDGNEYLFNIRHDARERANLAHREPQRLVTMRRAWCDWNASMPAIADDATVSLGYSVKDMPQR